MLRFFTSAALGAAALLATAGAGLAVEAAATSPVNVRTGPGTGFSIVDRLDRGEVVNIRECTDNNWCFVEHTGPDGWVSATYLTAAPGFEDGGPGPGDVGGDCSIEFVIGPDGPRLSINCGEEPPPPPPPPPPAEDDEACFYTGTNYSGTERCYGLGTRNTLPDSMNDRISSVRLSGDARARLCVNQNLGGACRTISADTPVLPADINNRASSLRVTVGAPPPPPPPAEDDEACFYTGSNYGGTERCYGVGVRNTLPDAINDRISSVRLFGEARALLCVNQNLGGICRSITANTPELGAAINNRASSLEVSTGGLPPPPPPPEEPFTHSSGSVALKQTFSVNLDNGVIGGSGVDLWYEAVSHNEKYLTPRNGALVDMGDGSYRSYAECSVADFSDEPIPLWDLPVGSYVCVRTNAGRISHIRLKSYSGTTMNLNYTTWEN